MTEKNRAGFSHHEQLRYEYLLSNIQYLNEKERQEFNYLYNKMKLFIARQERSLQREENRVYGEERTFDRKNYQERSYQTDNHLPPYPKSQRVSPKRSERRQEVESRYNENVVEQPIKPSKKPKRKKHRFKTFLKVFLLCLMLTGAGMIFMFVKGLGWMSSQKTDFKPAVVEYFDGQDTLDGTNILILGSDQRVTEESTEARTDIIMVLNVGGKDGKMKLVSFMRDTLVNIPGVSYEGYLDQKLNTAFTIGEQDNHQGAELMRIVLKENFDIDIKYYVMIDFQTFAEAVDTLFPRGVSIDAKFATVDGYEVDSVDVPDDLRMENGIVPDQTISVGKQRMDGRTLLNYARFRKDDEGDFGRTKRQQQVMSAMLSQIKDPTKLFTGSEALGKIYALTSTNVSYPLLLSEGVSTFVKGNTDIERVTIPELGDWQDDYDAYGGQALLIDFEKYQERLSELGFR